MSHRDRLDGWKEIAEYLNRSVKTAQRWEAELGLPVHRVGGRAASVFAFRSEVDGWLVGGTAGRAGTREISSPDLARTTSTGSARRTALQLVLILLLAVAALASWMTLTEIPSPAAIMMRDGHALVALDATGTELWSHIEPHPFSGVVGNPGKPAASPMDLDGDGINEVLAVLHHPNEGHGRIVAFSSGGEILWELRIGATVAIDGRDYLDSYSLDDVVPVRAQGELWLAAIANHKPWFPGVVAWIRPVSGEIVGRYLHAGYLFAALPMDLDGEGSEVLVVGGFNNLLESPVVAVIEPAEGHLISPGPESWEPAAFAGRERAYLRFEPAPIARLLGYTSWVRRLEEQDGLLRVEIDLEAEQVHQERVYVLAPDLSVSRLEIPRSYRAFHSRLQAAGRVTHEFADERASAEVVERLVSRQ